MGTGIWEIFQPPLMYYDGVKNNIYTGRNRGWGVSQTQIIGNITLVDNFAFPADKWIYSRLFQVIVQDKEYIFGSRTWSNQILVTCDRLLLILRNLAFGKVSEMNGSI